MPFKSEAQRKYLWANEPEIARDWTDTYGSEIQAADGGRIPFAEGSGKTSIPEWNLAILQTALEGATSDEERAKIQADIDRVQGDIGTGADTLLGSGEAPSKGFWGSVSDFFLGSPAEGAIPTEQERIALINSMGGSPEGIMKAGGYPFMDPTDANYIPRKRMEEVKRPIQDFKFSEYQGPSKEEEGWDYTTGQGITSPNKWQQFLSKVTRQPYRAATAGAGGYNAAQLNSMNALGGYYSEPMRQYRRDMGRIGNMWQRQAQGKKIGDANLQNLLTQYGGAQGLSDRDLSTIGQKTFTGPGQAFEKQASKGTFTTPSGEKGYYGGRATGGYIRSGYSRGGRVGILAAF